MTCECQNNLIISETKNGGILCFICPKCRDAEPLENSKYYKKCCYKEYKWKFDFNNRNIICEHCKKVLIK